MYRHWPDTRESFYGLLNCEIGGLDYHVTTTKYRTRLHCIHISHLFCNALVHVIYSRVSGQCSHTVPVLHTILKRTENLQITETVQKSFVCTELQKVIFVHDNYTAENTFIIKIPKLTINKLLSQNHVLQTRINENYQYDMYPCNCYYFVHLHQSGVRLIYYPSRSSILYLLPQT